MKNTTKHPTQSPAMDPSLHIRKLDRGTKQVNNYDQGSDQEQKELKLQPGK